MNHSMNKINNKNHQTISRPKSRQGEPYRVSRTTYPTLRKMNTKSLLACWVVFLASDHSIQTRFPRRHARCRAAQREAKEVQDLLAHASLICSRMRH